MKKYWLLISLFFLHIQSIVSGNDIYFSKIGIDQGLSQLSVVAIYQDELGRMWFGTREGVNLYSGKRMHLFHPAPNDSNSLLSNVVLSITGDGNGSVYILSHEGINRYDMIAAKMCLVERGVFETIAFADRKLWASQGKRLYYFENNTKRRLYLELPGKNAPIRRLLHTDDGRIFIGTTNALYLADKNRKMRAVLDDCSQVAHIYEDSKKNIWVATWEKGLFRIDRQGGIRHYMQGKENSLSSNFVRNIVEDNQGNLWIGTRRGLDKMDVQTASFQHYDPNQHGVLQLSNESVWALHKDRLGTIWVGTYFGGINYFNPEVNYYTYHNFQKGSLTNQPFPIISDMAEADNGHLFLCTEGYGLIDYNPENRTYTNYRYREDNPYSLSGDNIKVAYIDRRSQKLWLGIHLGGITCFDLKSKQFTRYDKIKPEWEQSNIVRAIVPYQDELLIATYNGLFAFRPSEERFKLFSEHLHKIARYIVDIKLDNKNNLWIAGNDLIKYNLSSGKYRRYKHEPHNEHTLSGNNPTKILVDSKNRIWIATNGSGINLYDETNDNFIRYNSSNSGLKNNFISNLKESKYGYILIATSKGLSMLDPESGKVYNYSEENGLALNSLYNGGMTLTKSGELYLAGMNGLVSFFEERLSDTPRKMNIRLMGLGVNNKNVEPNDGSKILKVAMPYVKSLKLKHNQTMLSFEFAVDNYIPVDQHIYRYRLRGLSDDWSEMPPGVFLLNFMHLSPGKYTLELQAIAPTDGQVSAETTLDLHITPPFYASWIAYLIYLSVALLIVWRIIKFNQSQLLLKTSLAYEKREKENIEAVNQSKLRFFTNISHEFRTPLTLIAAQVDMIMQSHNIPPTIYNRILNIKRNTQSMQGLITELLEFRKSEQGHLSIKVGEHDLITFLYEIFLSFQEHAKYRQIDFFFDCKSERINLWFDPAQMQKVFYNLISNAFKYTPKKGIIRILVEEDAHDTIVKVIDSGIGIKPEDAEKVFDRFYQAENGLTINSMTPGTGIGLALTKNILEAHASTISVKSEQNVGSQFIVKIKKGSSHFTEEQKESPESPVGAYASQLAELDNDFINEMVGENGDKEKKYSMLIVEDNDELRLLLQQIFEPIYNIHTAVDGEEGLSKTIQLMPDIVLSDLMMPKMSGSDMCSSIKNNFMAAHIPVVLLTAQTAMEYNIEGLRLGADDYVTKPFNVKALITRCNNLVNGRKMLQQKFSKQAEYSPHLIATNRLDQEFLEKAQRIIEDNLDNPDFDVDTFSSELALGRTRLFAKIKGITGQTPNEFIINVRMKKATSLLIDHPQHTIAEIAYMVGFNTPKYFAKCFKDLFGVTPTEYRKGNE